MAHVRDVIYLAKRNPPRSSYWAAGYRYFLRCFRSYTSIVLAAAPLIVSTNSLLEVQSKAKLQAYLI